MEAKTDSKNKNLLPKTLEEFMAGRKKQQTMSSLSTGKKTARKDEFPLPEPPKEKSKLDALDEEDIWSPNQPLPEIKETLIYSEYEQIKQEMKDEHFEQLRKKIEDCLAMVPIDHDPSAKVSELMRELQIQLIGSEDLEILERQFGEGGDKDFKMVDPILQRNKLIGIFSKEKRDILYKESELLILEKGKEVYKQASMSGNMYIIIKGYVKILETKQTSYGERIVLEFTTLHQGSHFGSNALGDEELKHNTTTAVTSTVTYLLKIDSHTYKRLMVNTEENDFEKKIQILNLIPFLRTQTKMSLTPLISSMKILTYKFGEVVVRRGSKLDRIWIVGEGSLQVFLEQRAKQSITSSEERSKERSFVFGKCRMKPLNKARFVSTLYFPEEPTEKSLLYGNKVLLQNHEIEYTDQIVFGQLQRGQCFGGRALFPQFYKTQKQKKFPDFEFDLKSRLDVCCNCTKAIVYELDQKRFGGLPDSLQKAIIQGLSSTKDFDYEDIETKVEQKASWKKYATKIVQKEQKDNKHNRAKSLMTR